MTASPPPLAAARRPPVDRRAVVAGTIVLLGFVARRRQPGRPGAARLATMPRSFEVADPPPAPPLELTDQDGRPFTLASLAGRPVLVFFGYTHCPDVCPESIGIISQALAASPAGARAVFVSIDPERDDVAAMKAYTALPADGRSPGSTGAPDEVRRDRRRVVGASTRRRRRSPDPARTAWPTPPTSSWSTARAGCARCSRTARRSGPIAASLTRLLHDQPAPSMPARRPRDLAETGSPRPRRRAFRRPAPMPMRGSARDGRLDQRLGRRRRAR